MTKDELTITQLKRENQRSKKRWELTKFVQLGFTNPHKRFILSLSCKSMTGICNPREAAKGHLSQWFFCTHQKHRLILLWWGVLSNPLKGWPGLAGIANLIHPTARRFATMGSGLSLLQGQLL